MIMDQPKDSITNKSSTEKNEAVLEGSESNSVFFERHLTEYFTENLFSEAQIQSARDWSLLNHQFRTFYVIFEFLEARHFKMIVDSEATVTLLPHVVKVLLSMLQTSEAKNYNVKSIVITQMIPALILKTRGIMTEGITQLILDVFTEAGKVEWKFTEDKTKMLLLILKQQSKMLEDEQFVFKASNVKSLSDFLKGFDVYHKDKKEAVRVEGLKVIRSYLELFEKQVLRQKKGINEKITLMIQTDFLPTLNEILIKHLTDYFDPVREQAQLLLRYIIDVFIPPMDISAMDERSQTLQMLRANAQLGFAGAMTNKLRDAAEMEAALVQHIFKEPLHYVRDVIAIMMDETIGRDNLVQIVKEFNKKLPFIILNDFRIAQQSNSLRRVEVLKSII